jgi:hypothetical protein
MDMHSAQLLSGRRWQIAKLAALLCFAVACGLLVSSLAASPKVAPASASLAGSPPVFAAVR